MSENANIAKSLFDLITSKQLGMIRAIAREINVDHNEESEKLLCTKTEYLSKRAASDLIEHLQNLQRNKRGI